MAGNLALTAFRALTSPWFARTDPPTQLTPVRGGKTCLVGLAPASQQYRTLRFSDVNPKTASPPSRAR